MRKQGLLSIIIFAIILLLALFSLLALTGKFIENSPPTTTVISPIDNQVVNTKQPTFEWFYKDKENDPQTGAIIEISQESNFEDAYAIYISDSKTKIKTNKIFERKTYYIKISTKDTTAWGPWSEVVAFTVDPLEKVCDDGTPFYTCSIHKPWYCDGGFLKEKSTKCGCFENYESTLDDKCKRIEKKQPQEEPKTEPEIIICPDGTINKRCNNDRKYCDEGKLIDNCEICGCSSDFKCKDNICIPKRESFFEKIKSYLKITIGIRPTGETILNSPPKATIKKPQDNEVISLSKPKIEWFYSDLEKDKQTMVLIQVYESPTFENPYETYWSGQETSAFLRTNLKDGTYYIRMQARDQYSWGPLSDTYKFTVNQKTQTCDDGTSYFSCSFNKPLYCDGGILINDCDKCGCDQDYSCINKKCKLIEKESIPEPPKTCTDGTLYGICNKDRKYCQEGNLNDNCDLCGCEQNYNCINNKCEIIKPSFKDVLITIGKFVRYKIGIK